MIGRANAVLAACAAAITLAVPSFTAASDAAQTCNRTFALETLSDGNFEAFCRCDAVSTSLIRVVQRSRDFAEILSVTAKKCPAVESVFSEIITASVESPSEPDSDGRPDPEFERPNPPGDDGGSVDNGW